MMCRQESEVINQLGAALENDDIPKQYNALGKQVLKNLQNPVRIVFVGLPGGGKTSLINMILGRSVFPSFPNVDIVEVSYGADARTTAVYPDGSQSEIKGLDIGGNRTAGALSILVQLPEEILKQNTFCEVRLSGPLQDKARLLRKAVEAGQITVLCSETFREPEQALWKNVPDEVKDHSFLALTKADRQLTKGKLAQRIESLRSFTSEEFLGLFPVATLQGLAARLGGSEDRQDMWRSSGGRDLFNEISKQVRLGRSEDIDRATMLLAQFASATGSSSYGPSDTDRQTSNPQAHSFDQDQDFDAKEETYNQICQNTALQVCERLQKCADDLMANLSSTGGIDPDLLFDVCMEATSDLADLLSSQELINGDGHDFADDVRDGEEVLLLLQVENKPEAAEDVVSLMLQLKKEAAERVYAS